jgi:LytS/YehU family sensor histidine kinase
LDQTSCKLPDHLGADEADAVAIACEHSVLAHVGAASVTMSRKGIATGLTKKALNKANIVAKQKDIIAS